LRAYGVLEQLQSSFVSVGWSGGVETERVFLHQLVDKFSLQPKGVAWWQLPHFIFNLSIESMLLTCCGSHTTSCYNACIAAGLLLLLLLILLLLMLHHHELLTLLAYNMDSKARHRFISQVTNQHTVSPCYICEHQGYPSAPCGVPMW
jgi:hypothetical protein